MEQFPETGSLVLDEATPIRAARSLDLSRRFLIDRGAVVVLSETYRAGERIERHRHAHAQLLVACSGTVRVTAAAGSWLVPAGRAAWIPADVEHELDVPADSQLHAVCIDADAAFDVPETCVIVSVSSLLQALVDEVSEFDPHAPLTEPQLRLVCVLLDQLRTRHKTELHLPLPRDKRCRVVADRLLADPSDRRTLEEWARVAGGCSRTLSRLFEAETGMSFREWRRHLRAHAGLAKLASGQSVTQAAFDVGFDSTSSFIEMFRHVFGATPTQYFRQGPARSLNG